jgi:hypothetical protein
MTTTPEGVSKMEITTQSTRVPAGFYRELLALRQLRDATKVYHDKYMLDEVETAEVCCVEGQHDDAVAVHNALDDAFGAYWGATMESRP